MSTWVKEGAACVLLRKAHSGFETMVLVHITRIDEDGDVHLSVPGEQFYWTHKSPVFDGYHKIRATVNGMIEHFLVHPNHPVVAEATRDINILVAYRRVEKACEQVLDAMRMNKVAVEHLEALRLAAVIALADIEKELVLP